MGFDNVLVEEFCKDFYARSKNYLIDNNIIYTYSDRFILKILTENRNL